MRTLCLVVLVPLATTACTGGTFNYAGPIRPIAGTCDAPSQALLTLRDKSVIFAPESGILLLKGAIDNQAITATLTLTDPNKQPYRLSFQGARAGHDIAGTYTTPRCRYAVTLHLTSD